MASITITGMDELLAKLGKLERVQMALKRPMDMSVKYMQDKIATYPGPRAGSTYRRTRRLGNSWTSLIGYTSAGIQGKIGNVTEYGPFVQGEQQQWYHRETGWKTTSDVAGESEAFVRDVFDKEIRRITGL